MNFLNRITSFGLLLICLAQLPIQAQVVHGKIIDISSDSVRIAVNDGLFVLRGTKGIVIAQADSSLSSAEHSTLQFVVKRFSGGVAESILLSDVGNIPDLTGMGVSFDRVGRYPDRDEGIDEVVPEADEMPILVGGLAALQRKIRYPDEARRKGVQGQVMMQFIVDKNGNVKNAVVTRGIGSGCDEEALRVIREAKFTPGIMGGKPVSVQFALPIRFRLR